MQLVYTTLDLSLSMRHSPVTCHYHSVTHLSLVIFKVSLACHLSLSMCHSPVTCHYQCVPHLSLVIINVSLTCHLSLFRIEVRVRRVGGGFGAKQSRSTYPANAAALAAYHLQRPVSVKMTIEDNMEILGRRQPMRMDYQVSAADRFQR